MYFFQLYAKIESSAAYQTWQSYFSQAWSTEIDVFHRISGADKCLTGILIC